LEERNRALESELALLRGDAAPPSYVSTSSSSPSMASSVVLSMSSSSASSKPSSSSEPNKGADRGVQDMEMADGSLELEGGDRLRCEDELRGRRLGRTRDKALTHAVGLGLRDEGMEI